MGSGKSVPMPVIAVAIVVLLAFVGYMGWKSFQPEGKPVTEASKKADDILNGLADKSKGDFSKLSPDEQAKINGMTGGHGAQALKIQYDMHH